MSINVNRRHPVAIVAPALKGSIAIEADADRTREWLRRLIAAARAAADNREKDAA